MDNDYIHRQLNNIISLYLSSTLYAFIVTFLKRLCFTEVKRNSSRKSQLKIIVNEPRILSDSIVNTKELGKKSLSSKYQ